MMYNGAINLALFLVWAFSRCFSSIARSQMLTIYNLSRTVFIKEEKSIYFLIWNIIVLVVIIFTTTTTTTIQSPNVRRPNSDLKS